MRLGPGLHITQTAAVVAPFSPLDLPNLVMFVEFDDSSTVTLNGSDISAVTNKGSGSNFAQGTAAEQPLLNVAGVGGLDSAQGDASEGLEVAGGVVYTTSGCSLYCIAQDLPGAGDRKTYGERKAGGNGQFSMGNGFSNTEDVKIFLRDDGGVTKINVELADNDAFVDGVPHLMTYRDDGGNFSIDVDNGTPGTGTYTPGTLTSGGSGILGRFDGTSLAEQSDSDVQTIVAYSTILSDEDDLSVKQYLADKAGITLS